jgi:hypothetical protein
LATGSEVEETGDLAAESQGTPRKAAKYRLHEALGTSDGGRLLVSPYRAKAGRRLSAVPRNTDFSEVRKVRALAEYWFE